MPTVYTYILYVSECVRIYSGYSKRIPSLGSPRGYNTTLISPYYARVESAHNQRSQSEVDRVKVHITPHTELRESIALDQGHI